MQEIILLVLALGPAILFFRYLQHMDRAEPEPAWMVNRAFWYGVLSVIPAVILELILEKWVFHGQPKEFGPLLLYCLIAIALVEEVCKLVAGLYPVWNDPEFNEENDGIVYVTAATLGFAAFENLLYVFPGGFSTGVVRALMAIPMHMCCGVMMGYYAGLARFSAPQQSKAYLSSGIVYAVIIHGVYDACLLSGQMELILLMFLAAPVFTFRTIFRLMAEGRELSIQRKGNRLLQSPVQPGQAIGHQVPFVPSSFATGTEGRPGTGKPGFWMIALARGIYFLCGGFWLLLLLGIMAGPRTEDPIHVVVGGVILTALPLLLARQLGSSHHASSNAYRVRTIVGKTTDQD